MFLDKIPVRLRLSLGHAVWMALLFLCVGCGLYKFVEINLKQSVDAALIASAKSIRDARSAINYRSPFTQSFLREFFGENFIRPYAQLVDLSGRVSARTENIRISLPVTPQAASRAEHGMMTIEDIPRRKMPPMRQITLPIVRKGKFTGELIQVGAPMDATYHTLRNISMMLWISLALGLILSIVFGYILTAYSLKSVKVVTRAASRLSSDDLNLRLPLPRANDEIRELTGTFNGMLDRMQDGFKRIRRFAGDVSHELRTPLTVLRGEAELALRREREPAEYKKSLEIIAKEATHMTDIVEDLLLLARAQGQSVSVNWEMVSMNEFLDLINVSVQPIFTQKQIDLKINTGNVTSFQGSSGYLGLAIKNILLNAAKHSSSGSRVNFTIDQEGEFTRFVVADAGEGIPPESLPYIFDPFYRADTARNRQAGGSGIGLSLTNALVKLHSGKVSVTSELGQGSTFEVLIPKERPSGKLPPTKKVLRKAKSDWTALVAASEAQT